MTHWQDYVLAGCGLVFLTPLALAWAKRQTVHWRIAVPTALGCYVVAATQATLGLYWTALMSFLTATLWLMIRRG